MRSACPTRRSANRTCRIHSASATGRRRAGAFTRYGARPWLPLGDVAARNVADQRRDPSSTLNFVHDLIAIRRQRPDLRTGAYTQLRAGAGVWAWHRGRNTTIALNLTDKPVSVPAM